MVVTELNDIILLQSIGQEDGHAFRQLFDRYWELLYQLASKKTGDPQAAEDLVQELFIELWRRKEPVQPTASLRTYLISCIYLKVFQYFRQKGFREKHYAEFARFADQHMPEGLDSEAFEAEYAKLQEVIDQTVALMPPQMQAVFSLKHYENETVVSIAEQLNISTETVKSHLKLAMVRLRKAGREHSASVALLPILISMLESSY